MDRMLIPLGADMVGKLPDVIESFNQYVMEEPLTIVKLSDREKNSFDLPLNCPLNWNMANVTSTTAEEIAIYVNNTIRNQTARLGLHPYYIRPSDAEIKRAG